MVEIRRPSVGFSPRDRHREPFVCLDPLHDADGLVRSLQFWALLDVKFEMCPNGHTLRTSRYTAQIPDPFQLLPDGGDRPSRTHALKIPRILESNSARPDTTPHHADGILRTLLVGPIHHAHGSLGLDPVIIQRPQHLHPRSDTQDPIKPPPRRLGIQMTPHERRRGIVGQARTHCEYIPDLVDVRLAAQRLGRADEPVAHCFVFFAEREALEPDSFDVAWVDARGLGPPCCGMDRTPQPIAVDLEPR